MFDYCKVKEKKCAFACDSTYDPEEGKLLWKTFHEKVVSKPLMRIMPGREPSEWPILLFEAPVPVYFTT